jgi:hypothetical protein
MRPSWPARLRRVLAEATSNRAGQMDLPVDVILSDFHKAARTHVAISVDKDPASGLVTVPAATWAYRRLRQRGLLADHHAGSGRAPRPGGVSTWRRSYANPRRHGPPSTGNFASSAEGALQGLNVVGEDASGRAHSSSRGFALQPGPRVYHGVPGRSLPPTRATVPGWSAWRPTWSPPASMVIRERDRPPRRPGPDGAARARVGPAAGRATWRTTRNGGTGSR